MLGFHSPITWGCGVLLQAVLAMTACAAADPLPSIPSHERRYDIGLAYMPASRPMPMAWGLERIGAAADMIFIQGNFKEWSSKGAIDQELKFARERKLKVYMSLDLLNYVPARSKIELPDGVSGDFSTPAVQKLYLDLVRRVARDFQPDYFVLLVEVDMHKKHNPASYAAYVKLFPQAVAEVKRLSPRTRCGASLTYDEKHTGFNEFVGDFDSAADMLTVSTYPFWHFQPERIADTFLSDIAAASKKPLFISETSWVTKPFNIPTPDGKLFEFPGSPKAQAQYVARMAHAAKTLQEKGKLLAINFVTLADPPLSTQEAVIKLDPSLIWFNCLGLFDEKGVEKPAYDVLKRWHEMKRSER